jgi:GTP-binding protein Era
MRSGYVALVGRPNVGKSTLLNALAGEDVSIITPKPETTRDRIVAVVSRDDAQIVFVDTPGIHRPHRRLGEYMNAQARGALEDADAVVLVADATEGHVGPSRDAIVLDALRDIARPVILALNKVDRVRKPNILPLLTAYSALRDFAALIPVSAAERDGVDRVFGECLARMPEGQELFPKDTLTDRPERFLVAERIREAVIHETAEEIPYVTAVEIERFDEKNPTLHIAATVHVERPGQKKIIIGSGGERIRAIGSRARVAIEQLLGRHVFLELWVKVTPDWTRSSEALARLGYAAAARRAGKGEG